MVELGLAGECHIVPNLRTLKFAMRSRISMKCILMYYTRQQQRIYASILHVENERQCIQIRKIEDTTMVRQPQQSHQPTTSLETRWRPKASISLRGLGFLDIQPITRILIMVQ